MAEKIQIDPKIKEIVKLVKDVLLHIVSYWYLLVIFIVLAFILGKVLKKPVIKTYQADLTFTISQKDISSQDNSDAAQLITEFSISDNSSNPSSVRLIELSHSNTVLTAVLFRKYEIEGRLDYLANHLLVINNTNDVIQDSSYFKNFVSVDSLTRVENAKLKGLISTLKRENIRFTVSPAKIFKITTFSTNEEFSKAFTESFYKAHSELYAEGATAKAQASYDFSEERYKEATTNLKNAEYSLAAWIDANHGLTMRRAYLRQTELERSVEIYKEVYIQALKSFEAAKVALDNQRPIFHLIDPPTYPLSYRVSTPGRVALFAQIGAVAFFFFITISLYFYKEYNYLIKELFDS